jgi:superoxide dismutase
MPYDIQPLSCHLDYGTAAATYADAFMDDINWTNVVRLDQAHAR